MTDGARAKGIRPLTDEWMPPYEPVQAIYVQRFMAIVERYGLKFSREESPQILALLGD